MNFFVMIVVLSDGVKYNCYIFSVAMSKPLRFEAKLCDEIS